MYTLMNLIYTVYTFTVYKTHKKVSHLLFGPVILIQATS